MDDIYYAILRVWHVLTAGKRGIVAFLGVVAVIVTVTSVFAAPLQQAAPKQTGTTAAVVPPADIEAEKPLLGATPIVSSEVVILPYEELSIGGVSSPGILPSSPFYFLKTIGRELTCAFTFDPVDKANLTLKYANEDALAIHVMCSKGMYREAAQLCFKYQADFFNSLAWTVKAKKQGNDVQALMLNLTTSHHGHRVVLAEALGSVDEAFHEAIIGAVTYTSAPFEYVIAVVMGPSEAEEFHNKLQVDFSSLDGESWLVIESRLGLDPRQVVELSQAMGETPASSGTPIITSVRASTTEVDPSASCDLTCMASDLDGDTVTYEWLATSGRIDGAGESVTWTAPDDAGLYKVKVVVSDINGNQTSKSISLRVGKEEESSDNEPTGAFWIETLDVEADNHSKLKAPALGTEYWTILVDRAVFITCVVDGSTDGVKYDWSCDVGKLSGKGPTISWEAPAGACYAHITVTAEGGGVTEEATVTFRVSTCAPCFG
jgi:hypothetical protein